MQPELVLDAADAHAVVALDQEQGQAAGVVGAGLAARQHDRISAQPLVMKRLTPFRRQVPVGLVVVGAGLDRAQVRAGIGLGEHHGAGDLAAGQARQDALLARFVAELGDGNGDLLQAKDGHQPGLGARDDLDHHLQDGLGQVQAAVLPGQHGTDQLGLAQRLQGLLGGGGVRDLPIVEAGALLVGLGGARRDPRGAHLAQHLQHQAVVVQGIGVVARGAGYGVVGVAAAP